MKRKRRGRITESAIREIDLAKISTEMLRAEPDRALGEIHLRTHQWFANPELRRASPEEIVHAHLWTVEEIRRRKMPFEHHRIDALDEETIKLLEQAGRHAEIAELFSVDPTRASDGSGDVVDRVEQARAVACDCVYVPEFLCLSGSTLYHAAGVDPNDLDLIAKTDEPMPDLERLIESALGRSAHWIHETRGPNWDYVPMADLVLRAGWDRGADYRRSSANDQKPMAARIVDSAGAAAILHAFLPDDILIEPDFAAIGGSFFDPESDGEEVCCWCGCEEGDGALWPKLMRMAKDMTGRDAEAIAFDPPSEGTVVSYDLVLRRRPAFEVRLVDAAPFRSRIYPNAGAHALVSPTADSAMREAATPTNEEQRQAAERAIGDWYLVEQPAGGKSFPWVLQEHIRGVLSPKQRAATIADLRRLAAAGEQDAFAAAWRKAGLGVVATSLDAIRRDAQSAADKDGDVSAAISRHVGAQPVSATNFGKLLADDRIVNLGNAHSDLRIQHPGGDYLIGWTNATPGAVLQFLSDGRIEDLVRNKIVKNQPREGDAGDNVVAFKKLTQPNLWLTLVRPASPEFWAEPGSVGATAETSGLFRLLMSGTMVYGTQKTDYHEYFFVVEHPKSLAGLSGRWGWQLVSLEGGANKNALEQRWLANRPGESRPYVFTHNHETELDKAKRDDVDLVWNLDAIGALKRLDYFASSGDALKEWEASDRAKAPEKNAVFVRPSRKPDVPPSLED